ncbi:MAG: chemotaxis protein [Candidatus Magnetominusculus sp. LBB02]|nr:chemotaxis protein [Candidatus Magnetominusculus sp. LBB02]
MLQKAGGLPEILKVGSNEMEQVVFKMHCVHDDGTIETRNYGVNVAKVREIIPIPPITTVPDMPEFADALAEIRGEIIPIIDLGKWMRLATPEGSAASKAITMRRKVIILEIMDTTLGIIVHEVERIRRIRWDHIKPPPPVMQAKHGGRITGVTRIGESDDLLLILDVESLIQSISALAPKLAKYEELKAAPEKKFTGNVLIVDDSLVARKILRETLENVGLKVIEAIDGKQAMKLLNDFLGKIGSKPIASLINLIITDVEMPEMDGLTFTKTAKSDPKLHAIPIIVNTSLSGEENKHKSKIAGADGHVIKFDVGNLIGEISRFFK